MATPNEIASAIVLALVDAFGREAAVEHFPDDVRTYNFTHSSCALLVQYYGGQFEQRGDAGTTYRRSMQFDVHVLTRSLRGPSGAQDAIERVHAALANKRFSTNAGRMAPLQDGFLSQLPSGTWQHYVRLRCTSVYYG